MSDVQGMDRPQINADALKSEIRRALINAKANACPIAMRMAWHASGTFDHSDNTGGSNGATMRFDPERSDGANAGLSIIRDLLLPVKTAHPELSYADLYTYAGCCAIEFLGGPRIPFNFGRSDDADGQRCPANGRLPDATLGAEHLRNVFYRMGFDDRGIVALSGGHTLGRAHEVRSGFDGPWTHNPLKFDSSYYQLLLSETWVKRDWPGKTQFTDAATGKLMMLPTDIALIKDPEFVKFVRVYAQDETAFFRDFAAAFGKLVALGTPDHCQPTFNVPKPAGGAQQAAEFRELAMHGSTLKCQTLLDAGGFNANDVEPTSGRSALHKAAFWGHVETVRYLAFTARVSVNCQDNDGETALHDAARFGHTAVAAVLLEAGAKPDICNKAGVDSVSLAREHGYGALADGLAKGKL